MQCVNCKKEFGKYKKSYHRTALLSEKRSESVLQDVFKFEITPKSKKEDRFLCNECEKLLKAAASGHQAKQELFSKTCEGTYLHRKRKATEDLQTPVKRIATASRTPLSQKKNARKMTTGARYFALYRYKQGFKYFITKSGAAVRALRSVLSKKTRRDMQELMRSSNLPNMAKVSLKSFQEMDFTKLVNAVKVKAPILYDVLTSAMTTSHRRSETLLRGSSQTSIMPVLGTILSIITSQIRPKRASLLQKMNAVQMWRSGCKRSLFNTFNRMGICVSEGTMLSTLDTLRSSFDAELMSWKYDLQKYVFPDTSSVDESSDVLHGSEESDNGSIVETSPLTSPGTSTDSSSIRSESSVSDAEWEDMIEKSDEEGDKTITYGDSNAPKGYTICWDNVGKQVKARRQTRNHGNKYKNWAMAYAIKNRICTTQFNNNATVPAIEIGIEKFMLTDTEKDQIRERLIILVQRILVKYVAAFKRVQHIPQEYTPHIYDKESCEKTEMFNIGIIDENPSSTAGVIKIIENLHKYVPKNEHGTPFTLITWGDGLSCERHIDAQNARANAESDMAKLKGLEPAAQDFHKRMLLLQDVMDTLYDGKSVKDKGTLFHLKNVFNQRSVSGHVSETFNYVADFIRFFTEGYVLMFAMDILDLNGIDDENEMENAEEVLNSVSEQIVEHVWCDVTYERSEDDQKHCFCQEDSDDGDEPIAECDNQECEEGTWFHLECVGLAEDNIPDEWFCSDKCRKAATQYCFCKKNVKEEAMVECCNPKCKNGSWFHAVCVGLTIDKLPKEEDLWYCSSLCRRKDRRNAPGEKTDRKFEYTKLVVWGGINDLLRREAVRFNDGLLITLLWKMDLPQFFARNHTKYFILGHRLIAALNGFLPERLQQELIWNRTVNIRGGRGKNDEADLVNEFLNREFKDSIRAVASKTTELTLERHGKLAGGVGKVLDEVFTGMSEGESIKPVKRKDDFRLEDLKFFTTLLKNENLTRSISGRYHKSFPKISSVTKINYTKFANRIKKLSKRLDKAKRVAL